MSERRRTVARRAEVDGIGLHLGVACHLTFAPAAPGAGIGFRRTDRPGSARVKALAASAVLTERRTQIGEGDEALHTVEHVLAAVSGTGLDDVTIEMDAAEPPILVSVSISRSDAEVIGTPGLDRLLDLFALPTVRQRLLNQTT